MARRPSPALTDAELRIMRALWNLQRATVAGILEHIASSGGDEVPAHNTVLTILGILERKGYVRHDKGGRAFTFEPIVDRPTARRRALTHLLTRFFDNSPELLVMDLFGHERLDAAELAQLREIIHAHAAPADKHPRRRKTS